jgi:hypothetical protein
MGSFKSTATDVYHEGILALIPLAVLLISCPLRGHI